MRDISLILCYNKIMEIKKCCFIGHRKINLTDNLKQKVFICTENLIVNENVKVFIWQQK